MTFKELGLSPIILKALNDLGHNVPTSIQELAIPNILKQKDVLGCAQTGTGKTAAFLLPIMETLIRKGRNTQDIRVLVLSPTRELAIQTRD
ncbi:MAG TPA: DEAD/DEAH box helicase, partial [Bacilli bacterium]|nr:DEAD/DEAH box helicase [Bacilli bacterium]